MKLISIFFLLVVYVAAVSKYGVPSTLGSPPIIAPFTKGVMKGELLAQITVGDKIAIDNFKECMIAHTSNPIAWYGICRALGYDVNDNQLAFDQPLAIAYYNVSNTFQMFIAATNWPDKGVAWQDYVEVMPSTDVLNVTVTKPFTVQGLTIQHGTLTLFDTGKAGSRRG